jgi:hypothetical protein
MDQKLAGNAGITAQIMEVLEKTAVFLVVLSPGYVASEWCLREKSTFLDEVKRRSDSRVFVVERDKLDPGEKPEEFRELLGYTFWVQENDRERPRTLGVPVPTENEQGYFDRLNALSYDLASQLKKMKKMGIEVPPPPSGPTVFLAEVTDDLEPRRDEVRNYLNQAGLRVLPASSYNLEPTLFQEAVATDLAQSALFVQLLSQVPGKRPPSLPQGYVGVQTEIARRLGKPILQWRDPSVDVARIENDVHRALLSLETVEAVGIEDFKRTVTERAFQKPSRPPPTDSLVFVDHDASDSSLADPLCDALGRHGAGYVKPVLHGDPAENRKDLEQNLLECDALVLVYGKSLTWVRRQLVKARKILNQRDRPLKILAVYEGPPELKEPLGMALPASLLVPNLTVLDGRNGLREENLKALFGPVGVGEI